MFQPSCWAGATPSRALLQVTVGLHPVGSSFSPTCSHVAVTVFAIISIPSFCKRVSQHPRIDRYYRGPGRRGFSFRPFVERSSVLSLD